MGISVQEALANGPLNNGKVLAGQKKLNTIISMVLILEVPTVLRWLKGGELLLTAGYVFKDDMEMGKQLIRDLAQAKIAALIIKPGQYIQKIPQELIDCAEQHDLPLIEIPPQMPYADIMLPIFEHIVNKQYLQLKKANEIHEQFFNLLLEGGNIESITSLLSTTIENPVLILDNSGNIWGKSPLITAAEFTTVKDLELYCKENISLFKNEKNSSNFIFKNEENNYAVHLLPIKSEKTISGFLIIIEFYKPLDQQDFMAIHQAATISALEFSKEKAVFEAEYRLKGDLLEDLLFSDLDDIEALKRRASFLNFNLDQDKVVFVILFSSQDHHLQQASFYADDLKLNILKGLNQIFAKYTGHILLSLRSKRIIGIANVKDLTQLAPFLEKAAFVLKSTFSKNVNFFIGIGRKRTELSQLRDSLREATASSYLGQRFKKSITYHEQSGVLELLFELRKSKTLERFFKRFLEPIIEYDAQHKADLYKTLEVYLENNCSPLATANSLFIHKNTVNYRLGKIQELNGVNFKNTEDFLNLQVAFKAKMIIDTR